MNAVFGKIRDIMDKQDECINENQRGQPTQLPCEWRHNHRFSLPQNSYANAYDDDLCGFYYYFNES